jgi:hypothetical protein
MPLPAKKVYWHSICGFYIPAIRQFELAESRETLSKINRFENNKKTGEKMGIFI